MKTNTGRCLLPIHGALALALVAACHNSSGGGGTTQELEVKGLEVTTADPELGHELGVVVELEAANATTDVGLMFLIADAAEVDAGAPEPALEVVDAEAIASVDAGTNPYTLQLELSEDTLAAGDYYLVALVDPLGAVPETDEENNSLTSADIARVGVRITLDDAELARPDLALVSAVADDPLVDVDLTPSAHPPAGGVAEVENSHVGLSVTVRSSGPDTVNVVGLSLLLDVPGLGLLPLQLWDSVQELYASVVSIPILVAGEPTTVHLDVLVPASARNQLASLLPPGEASLVACRIAVVLDQLNLHPEFEAGIVDRGDDDTSDNVDFVPVLLRTFRDDPVQGRLGGTVEQLAWDVPFVKEFSNGNVGVGVRFGASANVGANGIRAEAGASVPVTLVGSTIDLLKLDAVGLFNPRHRTDNGFVVTLKALNVKLYERRTKEDEQLASPALSLHQSQTFSTTFAVGPVPMFVSVTAGGTVKLDAGATVGSDLTVSVDPALDFSVRCEGGFGGSLLGWTLGTGVGGETKLIDEKFHAGITAGTAYDSGTNLLTGSITEEVWNEISGPDGRVFVFITATGKILWKTITERWEHVLANWQPFTKKDTLFNQTQSLSVSIP